MNKKCIIFGIGEYGREAYDLLKDKYSEILFSDNNEKKWGDMFCGKEIISPDMICSYYDYDIIIAILKQYKIVGRQLLKMGCNNIKVFSPFFDIDCGEKKYKLSDFKVEINCDKVKFKRNLFANPSFHNKRSGGNGESKKVLIIANKFPPCGGSGVQRPLKFAKYLKRFDYIPTVVAQGFSSDYLHMDYSLLKDIDDVELIHIQSEPILEEDLKYEERQLLYNLYYSLVRSDQWMEEFNVFMEDNGHILPDLDMIWVVKCIDELCKKCDLHRFDIVFTTSAPYSSHIIGYYLKWKYGLKWIMDYRDPWCLNDYGMQTFYFNRKGTWQLEKELELSLLRNTDYVTGFAEQYEKDIKKYVPIIRYKTITNGYDEDDFSDLAYKNNQRFTFVYNGLLYNQYDVSIIDYINELIDEGLIPQKECQLILNGRINKNLYPNVINKDKYGILINNGYLSHIESLQLCMSANVLLLFGCFNEGAYYYYTGKIFEYLRIGIPILSFSSPYGLHYELIERRGRGITATYDNKVKIRDFIIGQYKYWKENGHPIRYEVDNYIRHFQRERLTGELAKVFDEIMER